MSTELEALLVSNLTDLEAAIRQLGELDKKVCAEVDGKAEEWAGEVGWTGEYELWDDNLWLAPPAWRKPDEEDVFA